MKKYIWILTVVAFGCTTQVEIEKDENQKALPEANHKLTSDQTHNKWSRSIEPVLTINSGDVVEIATEEATDGQLTIDSDTAD